MLQDAINWLGTTIKTVTGINVAQSIPDGNMANSTVWVVILPGDGTFSLDAYAGARDLHNIRILLGTSQSDLKSAMIRLAGKPEAIADVIRADPRMGNTVSTFESITYQFVPGTWQDVPFLGYVLTVNNVKLIRTLTMS